MNIFGYLVLIPLLFASLYCDAKGEEQIPTSVQFIANKGQVTDQYGHQRNDIHAKIEVGGVTMFVGDGHLHYQWVAAQSQNLKVKSQKSDADSSINKLYRDFFPFRGDRGADSGEQSSIQIYRMDVTLVGANKNAEVIFEEPTGYYENYYTEHTGENGAVARGYNKITYKNVYPHIDWVIYCATVPPPARTSPPPPTGDIDNKSSPLGEIEGQYSRGIKYDFIVHPGANPADIKLRYEGATELQLNNGALIAKTPFGTIIEDKPYCYTTNKTKQITSRYILNGNTLSFNVEEFNGTLVIDPTLKWATYYGGTSEDRGGSVCADIYENIYSCGATTSTSNIATTGAHQTSFSGGTYMDGFVVKFDSSGTRLWGTYYGSTNSNEYFSSISCDKSGNVYVAGICDSNGSPSVLVTSSAHQTTKGGRDDALLVKFNTNGQRQWATFYGDTTSEFDIVNTCDRNGNVYIGGVSGGSAMGTSGTHKPSTNNVDGFIGKFNANGTRLWGTYYGGDTTINAVGNPDYITALACDASGNLYAGGYTRCKDNIATTGAHQTTAGSNEEGFLVKLNGNNGTRIWGTYYGGNSLDAVNHIQVDGDDNIYIDGITISTNNIASTGANQPVNLGGFDVFLAKFNSSGVRIWGTYYGGTDLDRPYGLSINPGNRIYLTGLTTSTTAIATTGSHQSSFGGNTDAFISEFSPAGNLDWGSYYGGNSQENSGSGFPNHEYTNSVAASNAGKIYIAGNTMSTNNIATSGAHQPAISGSTVRDAFIAAFDADTIVYIPQRYTDTVWCPGDTIKIVYGVNKLFNSGNNFTVQLSNAVGSFASPVNIGTKTATNKDTIICVIPINTSAGNGYRIRIAATNPVRKSWDNQWDIRIKSQPVAFNAGSNTPVCTTDTLKLFGSTSSTGVTWAWTGPPTGGFASAAKDTVIANTTMSHAGNYILKATLNSTGCSLSDTTTVAIKPLPNKPSAGNNGPVCATKTLLLTTGSSTTGVSYTWSGPGSYSSTTQNPTVTTNAAGTHAGSYISTVTLNGCSNRDTTVVVILPKPVKPTVAAPNSPLCAHQDILLTASSTSGSNYFWYGPAGFTANAQNPVRSYAAINYAGYYHVFAILAGCISDTDSVMVVINTDPDVNIYPTPGSTICTGEKAVFTAIPTNGGTVNYSWFVNNIFTNSTGISYSSTTLANGDIITCHMTSTGTCATTFYDTSNGITMVVQPKLAPSVTITASPNTSLFPNEPVTFTAVPANAGAAPTYQWRRNGVNIGGATGATWGANANALSNGDDICVLVKSNYACPEPDTALSNCIKLNIRLTVDEINNNNNIKIYPNPAKNSITIRSSATIEKVALTNLLGQQLISQTTDSKSVVLDLTGLAAGVYIIKVNDGYVERVVKE